MNLINIAAGVMLILIGIRYLRKGLDRLFGNRLLDWLKRMTANRCKGFLAGIVAGTMAPSSTSIALLSVQMLNRAALPAGQMLAVVLGANIGITVTVQLLSFHLEKVAGALLVAGGVAFLYLRRPVFRGAGQVLLAFGLIFLAMQVIGASAQAMATSGDFTLLFGILEHYPWFLLVATAALTVCMQSSTASIALAIGLAQGGLLGRAALVPWVLGTNVGIAVTALIAGWTSVESRRLGAGGLLLKAAGALACMAAFPVAEAWGASLPHPSVGRVAADLHTGFNLVLGLAALPFLRPLSGIMNFLVPSPPENGGDAESYLDPLLLQSPSLALNQAAREEFRMMDELKAMLRTVASIGDGKTPPRKSAVDDKRGRLESIGNRVKAYLGQIGEDSLGTSDARWKFILLNYIQELTAIGILIQRDFADAVVRQAKGGASLPPGEQADIAALVNQTLGRMEKATSLLMNRDVAQAEAFIAEKEEVSHWCRHAQQVHLERTPAEAQASPAATSDYLDQLNSLRRINSHLTSAAYAVARPGLAALEASRSPGAPGEK